jgi:hypothetical protein
MLYCVMRRTQLYLEADQYRWLKARAGSRGSIAQVVRDLIDAARRKGPDPARDPFIRYLFSEPATGGGSTSVADLDKDLYG